MSDDRRINRDFFRNKIFFDIVKTLYVDDYIHYHIRIFATLFTSRNAGVDVANKTETFSSSRVQLDD